MRTLTRCPLLRDPAHEAKPLARDRTDRVLLLAVVTDRLAGEIDVARECRFRDDSPGPDGRQDVILADHTLAVLHQYTRRSKTCGPIEISSDPRISSRRSMSRA